jgi:hypothetical protein
MRRALPSIDGESGFDPQDIRHKREVPAGSEIVCFLGQTASDRRAVRTKRLTRYGSFL